MLFYKWGDVLLSFDDIVTGLFIGIVISMFYVFYNKMIVGRFVRLLVKNGAVDLDSALTANEINYKITPVLRLALRKRGLLGVFVKSEDDKLKIHERKFYIPEEKIYRAERIYCGRDVDPFMLVVSLMLVLIMYAVVVTFVPYFFNYLNHQMPNFNI